MRGDIELMGVPPVSPTRKKPGGRKKPIDPQPVLKTLVNISRE